MNCWRVGTSWGDYPVLELFEKFQIVFFGADSKKIGDYKSAKPGDLLAITKFESKEVIAIAKMETKFDLLSSFPDYIRNDSDLKFTHKQTWACKVLIVKVTDTADRYSVADYKRFYGLNEVDAKNTQKCWNKYFINKIKSIEKSGILNLFELGTVSKNFIRIPAVQRGLVWKPQQTELLWDSILRGFPIGSFILYSNDKSAGFDLMDGQQRYNAISLGFNFTKSDRAKLWLDLGGEKKNKSTRKYWIKATTKAHPWGYKNDDDCSFLSAAERRNALNEYGLNNKSMSSDDIDLNETWPIEAQFPIPLAILTRNIDCEDEITFRNKCLNDEEFINLPKKLKEKLKLDTLNKLLEKYYPIIKNIEKINIPFSILQKAVIEKETESEDFNEESDLEVLFRRITSGGTQITQAELSYSAIKVYWSSIRNICEDVSSYCMPAHSLAILVFRLYLIIQSNKWVSSVSIKKIRELSESESKKEIEELFKKIPILVGSVNEYLCNEEDGVPKVIRTDFARNYSDIYLLLLWFEYKKADLSAEEKLSLACFLKWFTTTPSLCVQSIFLSSCKSINKESILTGLLDYKISHDKGNLFWLCSPEEFNLFQEKIPFEKTWRKWQSSNEKFYELWKRIIIDPRNSPDLLLYTQREYFKSVFKKYDPSKSDLWATHNRPWDFDHIIPHDWVYNKKNGEWREFDKEWINTVGNFAAIPFEQNRSKSNSNDWSYYEKNKKPLFFKEEIKECSKSLVKNRKQSEVFASITKQRISFIYNEVYSLISKFFNDTAINSKVEFPVHSIAYKRKEVFESIQKELLAKRINSKIICLYNSDNETEINCYSNFSDWTWEWLSIEVQSKSKAYVYSISANDLSIFEVGIRIAPNQLEKDTGICFDIEGYIETEWWYAVKEVKTKEEAMDELETLLKKYE